MIKWLQLHAFIGGHFKVMSPSLIKFKLTYLLVKSLNIYTSANFMSDSFRNLAFKFSLFFAVLNILFCICTHVT